MIAFLRGCNAVNVGHLVIEASVGVLAWVTWLSGKRHGEAKAWRSQDRRDRPRRSSPGDP